MPQRDKVMSSITLLGAMRVIAARGACAHVYLRRPRHMEEPRIYYFINVQQLCLGHYASDRFTGGELTLYPEPRLLDGDDYSKAIQFPL